LKRCEAQASPRPFIIFPVPRQGGWGDTTLGGVRGSVPVIFLYCQIHHAALIDGRLDAGLGCQVGCAIILI